MKLRRFVPRGGSRSRTSACARSFVGVACLSALSLALLAGCIAAPPPPQSADEYAANAKRAYEEALETFHAKNWELVAPRMEDVKRNYGYSRYARLAELRIADAAFHRESFAEAVTGYRSFVHDYPNDPEVPYARYRITRCQFLSSGDSLILPPLEERDLSSVKDAHQSITAFIADYPNYKKRAELDYMLAVVAGMMVRHELYVARYYLHRSKFDAAIARCEYALRTFKNTGLEAEAYVLLGETYMKMKKTSDARKQFNHVLSDHPDSAFVVPARHFLAQLGEPIAKKRIP